MTPSRFLSRRAFLLGSLAAPMVLSGCSSGQSGKLRIGFMPKLTGIPYFNACKRGAEEAAEELKLELKYNGPTSTDSAKQIEIFNHWVSAGEIDVLCIACNDPNLLANDLRGARRSKVPVVTYDADSVPDARDCFVNQASYDAVAEQMVEEMVKVLDKGDAVQVGILTSSVQAPNQAEWSKRLRAYAGDKYPWLKLLDETEHGEDRELGIARAGDLIQSHPNLKGIIALTSVAVPAAAEAVRNKEKKGQIKVTGVSTPRDMRDYVLDGTVQSFVLWNPIDLGYLTVHVAVQVHKGQLPANGTIQAGRLKDIQVKDREVLLGKPTVFTRENIDKFDF
jgi:ABC-type sugar transport system substrate-binding protein